MNASLRIVPFHRVRPIVARANGSIALDATYIAPIGTVARAVVAATPISLTASANIQLVSRVPNSALLTSVTMPADRMSLSFYVKGIAVGVGTLSLGAATYVPTSLSTSVVP